MGWGALSERQIVDIVNSKVGINKVVLPAALASDYQAFSSVVASSFPTTTTVVNNTGGANGDSMFGAKRRSEKFTEVTLRGQYLISVTARLRKVGSPSGFNVVARIRKTSDDSIVATSIEALGVTTISTSFSDYLFTFNHAKLPNEDFRITVETENGTGGGASDYVLWAKDSSDTYAGGIMSDFDGVVWTDTATQETRITIVTSGNPPTAAKDGDTTSSWKSNSEVNPNIHGDALTAKLVSGLRIYWLSSNRPTNYIIEYSSDAISWFTAKSESTEPPAGAWKEYAFNTVYARYFRVTKQDLFATVLEMAEFEYYVKTIDAAFASHGHGDA